MLLLSRTSSATVVGVLVGILPIIAAGLRYASRRRRERPRIIPHDQERVLILGASSGIGRSIAIHYAKRGARVCLVARRAGHLVETKSACLALADIDSAKIIMLTGDYSRADDLLHIRDTIRKEWGGLDTVVVNAGVSALRPLLSIVSPERTENSSPDVDASGLARLQDVAGAALAGNYIGPMLSAVTFIPLLTQTSKCPAIVQTSSVAAVVPAPTRSLYVSTKAASLMLYRCLAIEHPQIQFSFVLPATVEGEFRQSAVDGGPSRESTAGIKTDTVARACIRAVDAKQRNVFVPKQHPESTTIAVDRRLLCGQDLPVASSTPEIVNLSR